MGLYVKTLFKWVLLGGVIGVAGGAVGSLFHIGVNYATAVRLAHPWILYLMPVGGLAIVGLYKLCHLEGKGTNAIIESVHFGESVPILLVPVIFVSTVITHLCGGSAGREGAALQIGGGLGFQAGKLLRLGEKDLPLATLCGMSGVFSALFGTPLTATVFALEVISVGVLYYAGLVPCITAAMAAYGVSALMGVEPTRFTVSMPRVTLELMLPVVALSILCALVSILFCKGLHWTEHLLTRSFRNPWLRVLAGAAILIVLSMLTNGDYNGAGMDVIARALRGDVSGWAWLWKLLFTAVTIGCGFKGGEVVPSFFVGAAFGCFMGGLLGLPAGFAAAIGLVAVFCGAVNCPIASVFLSIELFGTGDLLYFAMACAISYLLSGYCGLYSSQTILYSKMRAEFINIHTNENEESKLRPGKCKPIRWPRISPVCYNRPRKGGMDMQILNVTGLKKVYTTRFGGSQVMALRQVDFSVEEGEYVTIMGESGSGKTTLLNILAALDKPTAGRVELDGRDMSAVRESDAAAFRRDNLGFVFQEFNLLDTFTLRDNIYLPLVLAGRPYRELKARLDPIARQLGILELLDKYPYGCPAARSSGPPWPGR